MSQIKVVGFDPSFSNWGIAKASVDADTLEVTIEGLSLVETERADKKQVMKTSSDLARARELYGSMLLSCTGRAFAISEIPLGNAATYNNAILSAGIVTGVLASCPIPLIQVQPREVKLASIGHPQASKEEMIEWATSRHPDAPWRMMKRGGKMVHTAANEHLADAIAAIYAGLLTDQFRQALGIYQSMKEAA